jgi:HK97 family phage portal protein
MGLFNIFAKREKKDINLSGTFSTEKLTNGNFIKVTSNDLQAVDTKTIKGQLLAYQICAPVSAIVHRLANAASNGKLIIEDKEGNELTKNIENIQRLLKQPNPLQSWSQFNTQRIEYFKIFGEVFILPVMPFAAKEIQLFLIPNWLIEPIYARVETFFITTPLKGWRVNTGSGVKEYLVTDIWHYKNAIPNEKEPARGQSLLYACDSIVNNILTAIEAQRTLMEKKGMIGILSGGNTGVNGIPLMPDEKMELQNNFQNSYGLSRDKYQVAIVKGTMNWLPMSYPIRDLLLSENIDDAIKQLCNVYGYPPFLIGYEQATFNNVETAEKAMYQNTVIPEEQNYYSWFSEKLKMVNSSINIYFDHLAVLQQSEKEKADAFNASTDGVMNILKSGLSIDQQKYLLVYYGEMNEEEAAKLVGNEIKIQENGNA